MDKFLQNVLLFNSLSGSDLSRLSEMVEEVALAAGEQLFAEGSDGDQAFIIREGQIEVFKQAAEGEMVLGVLKSGEILGEMSLVEEGPRTASARARTDSLLLAIKREQFNHLLETSSAAALAMLHTIISRLRATEKMLRENERMAQLGALTSSVAHELDEPAEITQEGAEQLREIMEQLAPIRLRLHQLNLSKKQIKLLFNLEQQLHRQAKIPVELDPLNRTRAEEHIAEVLSNLQVAEPMNIAPMIVDLNYTENELQKLAGNFTVEAFTVVMVWLSKVHQMYRLFEKISRGAHRVSDIVYALKTYSALDNGTPEEVDIHDELEDAMLILRNKLKAGVVIRREYDKQLPPIEGYGEELNQVFVNILDNGIDAMEGYGTLTVRTYREDAHAIIEIIDEGHGILPSVMPKIFDPFFTTKPYGEGMGMGLHLSQKIVQKHNGEIYIKSQPGETHATVRLPLTKQQ